MNRLVLDPSRVIELRQYTLHPGRRDALIDLFDEHLLDPQEEHGMRVLGQFRDRDAPDRFVWLRGFPDPASRAEKLAAFYGGPVWKAHRDAANATMVDSDDVLLLRPVDEASGFLLPQAPPAERGDAPSESFVVAHVYLLREAVDDAFVRFFDAHVAPVMAAAGAPPLARFSTEYGKNDFPRLPVREGEHAFVWFTSFASDADEARHRAELEASPAWTEHGRPQLERLTKAPPTRVRLAPTRRSRLRHFEPLGWEPGGAHFTRAAR